MLINIRTLIMLIQNIHTNYVSIQNMHTNYANACTLIKTNYVAKGYVLVKINYVTTDFVLIKTNYVTIDAYFSFALLFLQRSATLSCKRASIFLLADD